jgi:hypothetical protein
LSEFSDTSPRSKLMPVVSSNRRTSGLFSFHHDTTYNWDRPLFSRLRLLMRGPDNWFQPLPSRYFFQVIKCVQWSTFGLYTPESYSHLYTINFECQRVQSVKTRIRLCSLLSNIQNHVCRKLIFAPESNSNCRIPH